MSNRLWRKRDLIYLLIVHLLALLGAMNLVFAAVQGEFGSVRLGSRATGGAEAKLPAKNLA